MYGRRFGLGTPDGQEMTQKEVASFLGISSLYFEAGKKDHAAAEKGDQPAYLTLHSGRIHDTIEITERNCSPGCG